MKNVKQAGYVRYVGQVTAFRKRYGKYQFSKLNGKKVTFMRNSMGLEIGDKVFLAKLQHNDEPMYIWDIHEIILPQNKYSEKLPKTWFGGNSCLVEIG